MAMRRSAPALHDANGGQRTREFGAKRRGRFLLHNLVQHMCRRHFNLSDLNRPQIEALLVEGKSLP
jgi:hypothetical protein